MSKIRPAEVIVDTDEDEWDGPTFAQRFHRAQSRFTKMSRTKVCCSLLYIYETGPLFGLVILTAGVRRIPEPVQWTQVQTL